MNPVSASAKLLTMGRVLASFPQDIRFSAKWLRSLLPNHNPLSDQMPWMTFRAIEWLESYLTPGMTVFEWGAGGSTLFFSQRAGSVISVEHDAPFHQHLVTVIAPRGLSNCTLLLREPEPLTPADAPAYGPQSFTSAQAQYQNVSFERYVKAIDAYPDASFHLVIVDGRARASCVARAISKVRAGGYLLLDNSERSGYAGARELLDPYPRTDWFGLVPWNLEPYQTSIWRLD